MSREIVRLPAPSRRRIYPAIVRYDDGTLRYAAYNANTGSLWPGLFASAADAYRTAVPGNAPRVQDGWALPRTVRHATPRLHRRNQPGQLLVQVPGVRQLHREPMAGRPHRLPGATRVVRAPAPGQVAAAAGVLRLSGSRNETKALRHGGISFGFARYPATPPARAIYPAGRGPATGVNSKLWPANWSRPAALPTPRPGRDRPSAPVA